MQPLELSQSVMDEYSARILLGTFERAASAHELSRRFAIPIAACYRRIKELEGMGLVYWRAGTAFPEREGAPAVPIPPEILADRPRGRESPRARRGRSVR